jgi:hypothetical protein
MGNVRLKENETGDASTFRLQDMMRGNVMLMSIKIHRYLFARPIAGNLCSADCGGPRPDRRDGACYD